MLDEEFRKKYPLSEYHGTHHQEGEVVVLFFNPMVARDIYALDEFSLYESVLRFLEHQRDYPQNDHNAAELQTQKNALWEMQEEKLRCNMPLEAPRPTGREFLTVLNCLVEPR